MQFWALTISLALAGVGHAAPFTKGANLTPTRSLDDRAMSAVQIIEAIMPSSTSCSDRGDECTTATEAAPFLIYGMAKYGVYSPVEMAGILALIAYESGELQYKKNTNQASNPGRGTANMQSGEYNIQFAAAMGLGTFTSGTVLDLTSTNNNFTFHSGAWFLSTQCSGTARYTSGDVDTWFGAYMACDGLADGWKTSQPTRWTYWESAKTAWGL